MARRRGRQRARGAGADCVDLHSPFTLLVVGRWCRIIHVGSFMGSGQDCMYARLYAARRARHTCQWSLSSAQRALAQLRTQTHAQRPPLVTRMYSTNGGRPAASGRSLLNVPPLSSYSPASDLSVLNPRTLPFAAFDTRALRGFRRWMPVKSRRGQPWCSVRKPRSSGASTDFQARGMIYDSDRTWRSFNTLPISSWGSIMMLPFWSPTGDLLCELEATSRMDSLSVVCCFP
jgi:hypothetical protein